MTPATRAVEAADYLNREVGNAAHLSSMLEADEAGPLAQALTGIA